MADKHTSQLREAFESFVDSRINRTIPSSFMGNIVSLDADENNQAKRYCTVQPIDESLASVSFISLTASDTSLPIHIPAVGSLVMVTLNDNNSGFISQVGDVERTNISPGTVSFGGLVKVDPLVDLLQAIEDYIDLHIRFFNLHTHPFVGVAVGAPGTTLAPTPTDSSTSPIIAPDALQNQAATHGNGVQTNSSHTVQLNIAQAEVDQARISFHAATSQLNSYKNGTPEYDRTLKVVNMYSNALKQAEANLKEILINSK